MCAESPRRAGQSLAFHWYFSGKLMDARLRRTKSVFSLENPTYQFRGFELDPAERRLSCGGHPVTLTPKVFDTLVILVERAGHVVSKDELMKRLWPRGYVEESNLTKNIWLIRRALNDTEGDAGLIETVPKIGYRFAAPVARAAKGALPESVDPVPPPPAAGRPPDPRPVWRRPPALFAGALVALLLALGVKWQLRYRDFTAGEHAGRTVAFVGFSNLSNNAKDAWLAPALMEMLGVELSAATDIEVKPDELVRAASSDLNAPGAGGYAPATLQRLRQRLEADYVISGSYLVNGSTEDAPLRVDIALQDARNGTLVASVSTESALPELMSLVTRAGATLRSKLGDTSLTGDRLAEVASLQPPTVDVARHVGFALEALRAYDPARAHDEIMQAIAEGPGYAPAYTILAQAWSDLGYNEKSRVAAEQAAHWAARLPEEQRLHAEAMVHSARGESKEASRTWLQLVKLHPASIEYRLSAIQAQLAAGNTAAAEDSLRQLRQVAAATNDPRVQLTAARIAAARDDMKAERELAGLALRQAQLHEAPGLVADAQLELGWARERLDDVEAARHAFEEAISGYRSMRNPRGEAAARAELATGPLSDLHLQQQAREELQRALTLDQSIGNKAGMTRLYSSMCSTLWEQGDRDGALTAAEKGLLLAQDTGDVRMQEWMLRAEATIAADDAATDEVVNKFREVVALDQRSSNAGGHSWSLASLADIERLRGELADAHTLCAQALAEAATLSDTQFAVYSGFHCANVDMDRGDTIAARAELQKLIHPQSSGGDPMYLDNARTLLAQLDIDAGDCSAASQLLRQAIRGFATAEVLTGEATAQALLALCAQSRGDTKERDVAAARARELRRSMTSLQEIYGVDIALAQLPQPSCENANPVERLTHIAAAAQERHWVAWSLEAQLAAWEVQRLSDAKAALRLQREMETTAEKHGFGRIVNRLHRYDHRTAALVPGAKTQILPWWMHAFGDPALFGPQVLAYRGLTMSLS